MKFIHLSDLHLHTAPTDPALKDGPKHNELAIADIKQRFADAEFCVVTGDVVADPDEGAYQLARKLYAEMPFPMHFVIGNHDDRRMALEYLPNAKADAHGFVQKVERLSYGVGVFLDTVRPGSSAGEYCPLRQEWLREQLRGLDGEPLFIFFHHAPFATGLVAMDGAGMDEASSLALGEILATHTGPKHLFFGHYHRPMSGMWRGMAFSCLPSMIVQISLELADREKAGIIFEPPQYGVVLTDETRTVVHYHQFASGLPLIPLND